MFKDSPKSLYILIKFINPYPLSTVIRLTTKSESLTEAFDTQGCRIFLIFIIFFFGGGPKDNIVFQFLFFRFLFF